jgi:hypothetical protein
MGVLQNCFTVFSFISIIATSLFSEVICVVSVTKMNDSKMFHSKSGPFSATPALCLQLPLVRCNNLETVAAHVASAHGTSIDVSVWNNYHAKSHQSPWPLFRGICFACRQIYIKLFQQHLETGMSKDVHHSSCVQLTLSSWTSCEKFLIVLRSRQACRQCSPIHHQFSCKIKFHTLKVWWDLCMLNDNHSATLLLNIWQAQASHLICHMFFSMAMSPSVWEGCTIPNDSIVINMCYMTDSVLWLIPALCEGTGGRAEENPKVSSQFTMTHRSLRVQKKKCRWICGCVRSNTWNGIK